MKHSNWVFGRKVDFWQYVLWRLAYYRAYRSCFPAKNKWSDISLCIKVLTLDWHLPLTAMLGECVTFETLVAYPQATGHLSKFSRLLLGLFSSKAVTPPPELQLALNGLLLSCLIYFLPGRKSPLKIWATPEVQVSSLRIYSVSFNKANFHSSVSCDFFFL